MISTQEFVHRLRAMIDQAIGDLADPLIDGGAADYPQYRQQVGAIQGLRMARLAVDDLIKKANEGL